MDNDVLKTIVTGFFSLATALLSIWLKDALERKRIAKEAPERSGVWRETKARARAPKIRSRSWVRLIVVLVAAFIVGMGSRYIRSSFQGPVHWEFIISLTVLLIGSLYLALRNRSAGSAWIFQLELLALWLAFASGWTAVHGSVWSDLVVVIALYWFGCAVVGALIVTVAKKSSQGRKARG